MRKKVRTVEYRGVEGGWWLVGGIVGVEGNVRTLMLEKRCRGERLDPVDPTMGMTGQRCCGDIEKKYNEQHRKQHHNRLLG